RFVIARPLSTIHKHRHLKTIGRKHAVQLEAGPCIEIAQLVVSRPAVKNNGTPRLLGSYVSFDALQEVSAKTASLFPRIEHQFVQKPGLKHRISKLPMSQDLYRHWLDEHTAQSSRIFFQDMSCSCIYLGINYLARNGSYLLEASRRG